MEWEHDSPPPVSLLQRTAGGELAGMSGVGRRFCQQSPASGPLLSKPIMWYATSRGGIVYSGPLAARWCRNGRLVGYF